MHEHRSDIGFPADFTWGVASASYQIEGGADADGRGESVWDAFGRKPGAIWRGQTGDVACDHYHRWREDVALLQGLGVGAYRLSISWPRVLPEGVGAVNRAGLDFYDRLVDALLAAGIDPWVTLFHWDYPQALFQRGGWLNRDSAEWFAEYAGVVCDALSDRVTHWIPQNEIQVFINHGHLAGVHAPGLQLPLREALLAGHHALLAHGKAVGVLRARAKRRPLIGTSSAAQVCMPVTRSAADIDAARDATWRVEHVPPGRRDCFSNSWWLDPLYLGRYPEEGLRFYGGDAPDPAPGDMETISAPLDFCGLNIYFGGLIFADADGKPVHQPQPQGYNRTGQCDWPVTPDSLEWGPFFHHERYGVPIAITENGHQNLDGVSLDGRVHDPQRIDYTHRYLLALRRAMRSGVPVSGYFHWTLLDNFEWAMGYNVRVGLVYTDYATQRRIPKDSYLWYRDVVRTRGACLGTQPSANAPLP